MAVDNSGNVYVNGRTQSSDFPTTPGAYDETYDGSSDTFVTKLNSNGTDLVYSTFLGGDGSEGSGRIAVDNSGNVYSRGFTQSSDFPTTPGAYDETSGGSFVTKLNSNGTGIIYSTFFAGSGFIDFDIAVDNSGNAYVTGYTSASDFPTTTGAYDETYNGGARDCFVTKFNSSGTDLIDSTFLGGSGDDYAVGIALDSTGNVYVTGHTDSSDFPTTIGAYDETSGGPFVTKFILGELPPTPISTPTSIYTPTPIPTSTEPPTVITLESFTATPFNDEVMLEWETATEIDNAGFNLYRAKRRNGKYKKINDVLIEAEGDATSGAVYNYIDFIDHSGRYFYQLEDIDYNGNSTMHGPVKVRVSVDD